MAFKSLTTGTGASPTSVAAPPGIIDGDLLVGMIAIDNVTGSVTWPAGFTEVTGSPRVNTLDGNFFSVAIKVAASESGSYSVTHSSGSTQIGLAVFSGRDPTVTPHRVSGATNNSANASPWSITPAAFSSATSAAGCDLLYIASEDIATAITGRVFTVPATFTKVLDIDADGGFETLVLGVLENQGIGHTGVLTGTGTLATKTSAWGVFAIALAPNPNKPVVDRPAVTGNYDLGADQRPKALRRLFYDTFTASNGTNVVGKTMDEGGVWLTSPISSQSPTIQSNTMTIPGTGGTYYNARTDWFDPQLGVTVRFTWVRQQGNAIIRLVHEDTVQFLQVELQYTSANVLTMYLWEYSAFSTYIATPNSAPVDLDITTPRLVECVFGRTSVAVTIDGTTVQAASSISYLPGTNSRRYVDVHLDQTGGTATTLDNFELWTQELVPTSDRDYGYTV